MPTKHCLKPGESFPNGLVTRKLDGTYVFNGDAATRIIDRSMRKGPLLLLKVELARRRCARSLGISIEERSVEQIREDHKEWMKLNPQE